jgi:hypothetical protein
MAHRSICTLKLLLGLLTSAVTAHAAEGTVLSTARDLAQQGLEAYDAGQYQEAANKLSQAYAIVRVPTLAVSKARALVKLRKFVAASELYLEATRLQKTDVWQAQQYQAQKEAQHERTELLPRIPKLKITLEGASPNEVSVSIDDVPLPAAMLGVEVSVDPHRLKVVGKRGAEVVKQSVTLGEGEHGAIKLRFTAASPGSPTPAGASPTTPSASTTGLSTSLANTSTPARGRSSQKLFGWIGVGVGSAGLALGAVSGIMGIAKKPSNCQATHCPENEQAAVDTVNRWLDISTVSFIAGGIVAATGVTLLLTAPRDTAQPRVGLWLNAGAAALYGNF